MIPCRDETDTSQYINAVDSRVIITPVLWPYIDMFGVIFFTLLISIHGPQHTLLLHTQIRHLTQRSHALYKLRLHFFPHCENRKSQYLTLITLAGWSIILSLYGKGRRCWTLLGLRTFRKATARDYLPMSFRVTLNYTTGVPSAYSTKSPIPCMYNILKLYHQQMNFY